MTSPQTDRPEWAQALNQARTDLGWDPHRLAKEMRKAAGPDATATTESLIRRIRDWEAGRGSIRERYRLLLARVLEIESDELAVRTSGSVIVSEEPPSPLPPLSGATLEVTFQPNAGVDAFVMEDDALHTLNQVHSVLALAAPEQVVEQLETDVYRLCRQYVSTPLHRLYAQITQRRHYALKLLSTLSRPDQTRRVHIAAARLVGLQAHACLDLGAYNQASTFADAAWALAANSGDPGLRGWVLGLYSLIMYWDDRPGDAQRAAEEGLNHTVTDSNRARLHALRARATAAQGDRTLARMAVATAQEHAALPLLPGVLGFPDGKISVYSSTALLMLDSPHDRRLSITHAEQAITRYSTGSDRSVGDLLAARLDLATAHLYTGNFDGVLEQVQIITATPTGHRTASITQRTQRLLPLLENTNSAPALSSREHLIAFGRAPGPASAHVEEG